MPFYQINWDAVEKIYGLVRCLYLVMTIIGCQINYIWNELGSEMEGISERFVAWCEINESLSSPDLQSKMTHHLFGPYCLLEAYIRT